MKHYIFFFSTLFLLLFTSYSYSQNTNRPVLNNNTETNEEMKEMKERIQNLKENMRRIQEKEDSINKNYNEIYGDDRQTALNPKDDSVLNLNFISDFFRAFFKHNPLGMIVLGFVILSILSSIFKFFNK